MYTYITYMRSTFKITPFCILSRKVPGASASSSVEPGHFESFALRPGRVERIRGIGLPTSSNREGTTWGPVGNTNISPTWFWLAYRFSLHALRIGSLELTNNKEQHQWKPCKTCNSPTKIPTHLQQFMIEYDFAVNQRAGRRLSLTQLRVHLEQPLEVWSQGLQAGRKRSWTK